MSSPSDNIVTRVSAIALFLLFILSSNAECQKTILDSTFTFRSGNIRTGDALDIITRESGYKFTYDSRLINTAQKTFMTFQDTKLRVVLDSILRNDSLKFSVIDKYIIISRVMDAEISLSLPDLSDTIQYITGRILDEEIQEVLPYATIAFKHNGKGTVTNNNGEFGLKITPDLINDTLSVSYLGYFGREIAVKQALGNNFSIFMRREYISIPEIIIRNQIPQDIISKAQKAIGDNYGKTPAYLSGFYREGVLKKTELQSYSEAVLRIFKSSYTGSLLGDQIKIFKSRKIENTDRTDTLAIRLKAGLSTCLELDGAKNLFDFMSPDRLAEYTYRLADIVTYDDEAAYVIEFEQRPFVDLPLYKGSVYINTVDYSILHAEFELNKNLIHKMKGSFVTNSSRGFNTWPESVNYSVSYRKLNNRYFLSHVRGDLLFTSRQKKKLFKSQFKVFFELAITDVDLKNVTRFEREEIAPIHSVFSRSINTYDAQFWGNQDFLRPEDNLLKALENMNVRLEKFEE